MNKNCGIYKITNLINGKCYIGQSTYIPKRWKNHLISVNNPNSKEYYYPLYQAMRKYGSNNFKFEIIENCLPKELNEKEQYWILYYNSYKEGYNQNEGGNSASHYIKLTQKQADEIIDYLINTDISQYQLAEIYDVDQSFISNINMGKSWVKDNLEYPLREYDYYLKDIKLPEKFCVDCGTKINNKATRCAICYAKTRRVIDRPSRQELKQLIRTLPFTKIGEKFGITDNAIRKWCDAENLPRKKKDINLYTDEEWEKI